MGITEPESCSLRGVSQTSNLALGAVVSSVGREDGDKALWEMTLEHMNVLS